MKKNKEQRPDGGPSAADEKDADSGELHVPQSYYIQKLDVSP